VNKEQGSFAGAMTFFAFAALGFVWSVEAAISLIRQLLRF
jgi:hypothetical protein